MAGRNISPLTRNLQVALKVAREANERRISQEQVAEERAARAAISRRKFLGRAIAATAGLAVAPGLRAAGNSGRIMVVGAGLAGLRFAHALWTRKGIRSTIYEANTRLGGRCWTNRDFFAQGQVAEHGGEFISSEHTAMRRLAAGFGFEPLPSMEDRSRPATMFAGSIKVISRSPS